MAYELKDPATGQPYNTEAEFQTDYDSFKNDKLTAAQRDLLVGGGSIALHYHDADRARANHTGTQSADTIVDGTNNKVYTVAEQSKLGGIPADAEANNISDVNAATLTNGSNADALHEHEASNIGGFEAEVRSVVAKTVLTNVTASRDIALTDVGNTLICDSSSAIVLTLTDLAYEKGDQIAVVRYGTGAVTFAASGTTINSVDSNLSISDRFAEVVLTCVDATTDTWLLIGALS